MNKEEWSQLDKLLGKEGFGGYYDLCECLKQAIFDINKVVHLYKTEKIQETNNLKLLMKLLNQITIKIGENTTSGLDYFNKQSRGIL